MKKYKTDDPGWHAEAIAKGRVDAAAAKEAAAAGKPLTWVEEFERCRKDPYYFFFRWVQVEMLRAVDANPVQLEAGGVLGRVDAVPVGLVVADGRVE